MTANLRNTMLVLTAGLMVGLSGCASTKQVEEAMSLARQAQSDASAAREAANKAASAASEASRAAASAQRAADAAGSAAADSKRCCDANSEKIDRMFKESMKK